MTIFELSEPYFKNHHLLMSNKPNDRLDGNAVGYTATLHIIADYLGENTVESRQDLKDMYFLVMKEPGLITRGPHKWNDRQAHDDPVMLASALYVNGCPEAGDFYKYGMDHGWFYWTAKQFTWKTIASSFFLRLPGVVQTFRVCHDWPLGLYGKHLLGLDLLSTSLKHSGATSGRIMDWCKIQAYKQSGLDYPEVNDRIIGWENDICYKYPRKMGSVFEIYFQDANHPFSVKMSNKL